MCSTVTEKIQTIVTSAKNTLGPFSAAFSNTLLVAITGGIEQVTTIAAYRCPCIDFEQVGINCTNATIGKLYCSRKLNITYGLSLIIIPAIIVFVLGLGLSTKYWKSITGLHSKSRFERLERCDLFCNILSVLSGATLYPIAWVSVALLDGKFLACALTTLPYDMSENQDCSTISSNPSTTMSNAFKDNQTFSNTLGWFVIAGAVAFGFVLYSIARYCFPLTYYHAQYYKFYRQAEEEEFKRKLDEDAKAQATASVKRFVESTRDERPKRLWDEVSTVFEFHRAVEEDVYSNLHQWAKKHKDTETALVNGTTGKPTNQQSEEATDNNADHSNYETTQFLQS